MTPMHGIAARRAMMLGTGRRSIFTIRQPRLMHVTLLKLKNELPVEDQEAITAIAGRLPGVLSVSMGRAVDNGKAGSHGYTDALVAQIFDTKDALEAYQSHPDNYAIQTILSPALPDSKDASVQLAYSFEHEANLKPFPALVMGLVIGLAVGAVAGRSSAPSVQAASPNKLQEDR